MSCLEGQEGHTNHQHHMQAIQHHKLSDYCCLSRSCTEVQYLHGWSNIADQMRKAYGCREGHKSGGCQLFYFLVDISVVNSHIICRETPHSAKRTLKEFILELADELMTSHCSQKHSAQPSLDAPSSAQFCERHFPKPSDKPGQR